MNSDTKKPRWMSRNHPSESAPKLEDTADVDNENEQMFANDLSYAKITFPQYSGDYKGKRFKVFEDSRLVWGSEITPPPIDQPCEYRNIIVRSSDPGIISIQPPLPFVVEFSRYPFSTPEQDEYDKQHCVNHYDNGFWYSVRGNKKNPRFLILTFPDFSEYSSRVTYTVDDLPGVEDAQLSHALLIAFQDRYHAHGTYMLTDDAGKPLNERFRSLVESLLSKYGIEGKNIVFYGASKGASIALMNMRDFPDSHLLIAAPHLNLRYYLQSDSMFRNSLFHYLKNVLFDEPLSLLQQYLHEGRKIDYFYSENDELANYSLIEKIQGFPSLNKYKIDAVHSEILNRSLSTILCLINSFLSQGEEKEFHSVYCDLYPNAIGLSTGFQICLPNAFLADNNLAVYLRASLSGTTIYQILTPSVERTIWCTCAEQTIDPWVSGVETIDGISVFSSSGRRYYSLEKLPLLDVRDVTDVTAPVDSLNMLSLESDGVHSYWVVNGQHNATFSYFYRPSSSTLRRLSVYCIKEESLHAFAMSTQSHATAELYVSSSGDWSCFAVLLSRVLKTSKLVALTVEIAVDTGSIQIFDEISRLDLPGVEIVIRNPTLSDEDYSYLECQDVILTLLEWLQMGRLRIVSNPEVPVARVFRPYIEECNDVRV